MTDVRPVLSTLAPGAGDDWNSMVEWIRPPSRTLDLPHWLFDVVRRARGRRAVILRGTSGWSEKYRDLLAAACLSRLVPGVKIVISDATIEPGSKAFGRLLPGVGPWLGRILSKTIIRCADGGSVTWCVLSTAETESFPRTWGVDPSKVVYTSFMASVWEVPIERSGTDYLFSGGNSLRDYELLLKALRGVDVETVIATSWLPQDPVSERITVERVDHDEFMTRMANARAVVLPLVQASRSTGQQTYLNAMWFGRPVIVTDAPGVRDHVEHGVTGIVVPPGEEMLRQAIEDLLDERRKPFYEAMGQRARAVVETRYRDEHYRRRLLEVAQVVSSSATGEGA